MLSSPQISGNRINKEISFHKLEHEDLIKVIEIQKICYSEELWESPDSFMHKMSLSPDTCLKVLHEDKMVAYFFSIPCNKENLPAFDDHDYTVPEDPDCFYLHDLAILPDYRKKGIPVLVFQEILSIAHKIGVHCFRIFSVQNTYEKWKGYGFQEVQEIPESLKQKLGSFKSKAYLMEMIL